MFLWACKGDKEVYFVTAPATGLNKGRPGQSTDEMI